MNCLRRCFRRFFECLLGIKSVPVPRPIILRKVREVMDQLGLTFELPAPGAGDVVDREFTVQLEGQEAAVTHLSAATTEFEVVVDEGTKFSVSLVDVDNAGNKSAPRTLDVEAVDTIAPPQPGEFGVKSVREV